MNFRKMVSLFLTMFFCSISSANLLFEGYSKVLIGGIHSGYFVNRYEFDTSKKQFVSIYFLKINEAGGNLTESLKAYCDDKFAPLSYQYTSISGSETKTIDLTFKDGKMVGILSNNGKEEKIDKILSKSSSGQKLILSTFLGYVMSSEPPKGLEVRKEPYKYQAIAEEDAEVYPETAVVSEIENINNIKTFKILNDFKNMKFTSYVTDKGDVLITKAHVQGIVQGISTELVADPKEATKNLPFNEKNLTLLFGNVPKGERNVLSETLKSAPQAQKPIAKDSSNSQVPEKKEKLPPPPKPSSKVGKSYGVPQGIGIQVKGK